MRTCAERSSHGAILNGADLKGANLEGADLRGALGMDAAQICALKPAACAGRNYVDDNIEQGVESLCPGRR